jgi:hypothetical protein
MTAFDVLVIVYALAFLVGAIFFAAWRMDCRDDDDE